MAEGAQLGLEQQLPVLQQLERVGLFTHHEIRAVVRKTSALEYKLHRRALSKEHFINFIQYEINFLELIKKRRARIGYTFKKDEIEYIIINRIHNVFKGATEKWKSDIKLWLSHIAFCKKWNNKLRLSKVFSAMLAIHPDKPALWIMAAKWELEDRTASESARHLFLRGLRFHPKSHKLYQEYFRMELMHAEKLQKEKTVLETHRDKSKSAYPKEILQGELARVVYKNAIEKIPGDAEFHLSLLTIAALFSFTQELQREILQDLQTLHTNNATTWDFLARRELEAEPLPLAGVLPRLQACDVSRREGRCHAVYEEAVCKVPTEAVWKCYITFCLERFKRKSNNKALREMRQTKLLSVFERARESNLFPETLLPQWLQLLVDLGKPEEAARVAMTEARYSSSVQVWVQRLQVLMGLQSNAVNSLCEEAFRQVPPKDSLPLWTLWLDWSENTNSQEEIEAIYQKALLSPIKPVSVAVKEKYLDWAHRTAGYRGAKRVFNSLRESRPFSLEFFRKMIEIEKEQEACKMLQLREVYERALREFGSTDADLWLDYIWEEHSHPHGQPCNVGKLHWRAMQALQGEGVEHFVTQYTLLQTGHLEQE
ncbi:U3 small nucleolar RNA-associated protein 6 homolog [Callorhinchus milii]|uniref:UTP6 small subunit processome component n=1 Tax=Callorhinchus milii TaxID=7868 RepID=V9KM23_CALMI|nr:U3 small nucleolar RNA-associated protein 6 homolog [Callorhinchus milii]|eukprot:gi/632987544/ref/XP_007882617.1/ PREDICTED: U3 small nucleolar RNA-associated protein 6 homolog [Callorhinchus milii]